MLLILCSAAPGANLLQGSASIPLTDRDAASIAGGGAWGDFFAGVGCGIGFTLLVSGYTSGVGAPAAALLTATTLKACATALGL